MHIDAPLHYTGRKECKGTVFPAHYNGHELINSVIYLHTCTSAADLVLGCSAIRKVPEKSMHTCMYYILITNVIQELPTRGTGSFAAHRFDSKVADELDTFVLPQTTPVWHDCPWLLTFLCKCTNSWHTIYVYNANLSQTHPRILVVPSLHHCEYMSSQIQSLVLVYVVLGSINIVSLCSYNILKHGSNPNHLCRGSLSEEVLVTELERKSSLSSAKVREVLEEELGEEAHKQPSPPTSTPASSVSSGSFKVRQHDVLQI